MASAPWRRSVAGRASPPREARHDQPARDRESALSRRHGRFDRLGLSALERDVLEEWHASTDALSQVLGERGATAAVPGGDISPQVLESGAAAGLRALFTSEPWLVPRRVHGCWILGRYIVKGATPAARIAALAAFRGWRAAWLVRRGKVAARAALPSLYRAYVARTTREWNAVAERP